MINGIINVYKPQGFTSFDVVAKLRGMAHQKKIGHTGTLDPDAVGVLPVCLGNATRVCDILTDRAKTYETIMVLGLETDTQDTSGRILKRSPALCEYEEIAEAIESFLGDYEQIPPMFSAKKVDGKKLYELARQGESVARKSCLVKIHELSYQEIGLDKLPQEIIGEDLKTTLNMCTGSTQQEGNLDVRYIQMRVKCSKGTYIRTLCHDIGQRLGCGGCMLYLKRTQVGPFKLQDAYTLDELQRLADEERLSEVAMPVDSVFDAYPAITVKANGMKALLNGNFLTKEMLAGDLEPVKGECYRVYDETGRFYAIYTYEKRRDLYKPLKMFL